MAIRKDDTTPKLKDIQIGCSWFPSTPAKPHSINQQLIRANWQEYHLVQANRLKTERLTQANQIDQPNCSESGSLLGKNLLKFPCQIVPACFDWTNSIKGSTGLNNWREIEAPNSYVRVDNSRNFDTRKSIKNTNSHLHGNNLCSFDSWQASQARVDSHVHGEDSLVYKFAVKDSDKWTIAFGNPLEQAQHVAVTTAADNAAKQTDFIETGRSSVPHFHPQNDNSRMKMSIENSSTADPDSMLGAEFKAQLNSIPDFLRDGSSIPSRFIFDLNSAPRMITDAAFRESMPSQFEPITPEKTHTAEYRQESAMSVINIGEMPTAQDAQQNKTARDEVKGFHNEKDHSKLVVDQLCATSSTQLQENHKPDNRRNKEANLSKTPQQKSRRRKHRPKVIIEGRRKSAPKPSAEKPTVPQKTTRVKKYVQRKEESNPVNTLLEGENNGTNSNNTVPSSKDTPLGKRKYEKRKGIDKTEPIMEKGTSKTSLISRTRSSSRRSLNFVLESQLRGESSMVVYELTDSANRVWEDYLSMPKRHSPSPSLCTKMDPVMDDHMLRNQSVCTRGKCQIVFTDVTHDKEANTEQVTVNPNGEQTPKSPSDSKCSSTCLTQERQIGGLKRHHTENNDGTPGMHFPAIYKKKRTERGHDRAISNLKYIVTSSDCHVKLERQPLRDSRSKPFTSRTNQESSFTQLRASRSLNDNLETDGTQNKQQISEGLLAFGPTKWIKKKRSKIPNRVRDLASLMKICKELPSSPSKVATTSRFGNKTEILYGQHTCMEALVADFRPTMKTKTRSKRSMFINQNFNNHHKFAYISIGPPLAITWKRKYPLDSVIEKLNQLDLNAKSSQLSAKKGNALMPNHTQYEEQHALVPYQRGGAIVPFDSLSDRVGRRQPRPKVDLDDETTRVWKLLLEDINSEGIDGTDEENRKWWEEERRVFSGRADSFIARMHLIQGDRRFSPWKGSVVDSVVGVFLTQNVSDHLSSSAFMSLAAHFPFESKTNLAELRDDRAGNKVKKPEVSVLDPNEVFTLNKELLNRTVCGEDPKTLQVFEYDDIRMVNKVESGNNLDGIITEDDSRGLLSDISKNARVMSFKSVATKPSLNGDQRDVDDALSSQTSGTVSQHTDDSPIVQASERTESFLLSTSEEEPIAGVKPNRFSSISSFVKLLQMAGTVLHGESEKGNNNKTSDEKGQEQSDRLTINLPNEDHFASPAPPIISRSKSTLCMEGRRAPACSNLFQTNIKLPDSTSRKGLCAAEVSGLSAESSPQTTFQNFTAASFKDEPKFSSSNSYSSDGYQIEINQIIAETQMEKIPAKGLFQKNKKTHEASNICTHNLMDLTGGSSNIDNSKMSEHKEVNSNKNDPDYHPRKPVNGPKSKEGRRGKEKQNLVDWDGFRKQAQAGGRIRERTANTVDSVNWDAVRCADVNEISQTIKERGMNNMLAKRIKDFLNRLVRDHGSIDLEWLRDVPPDKAKEYLLSITGLGLKSVECVRLLTLHQLAFPVDTNVGRIAVRLGWVPLQPLPESLQLHLLEMYPVLESIQKYLWPRLCKLDQRTLYELHYQMITFGKVFCTKSKPNCNACPLRAECRHFASAFASARFALPAPEEKSIVSATENKAADQNSIRSINTLQLPLPLVNQMDAKTIVSMRHPIIEEPDTKEPIIEVPATPEPGYTEVPEYDIEDTFCENPGDIPTIPTIHLNMEEFTHNLQKIMQQTTELQEGDMSKALVALTSEAASIPAPKLKNVSRLRTEHQVYELPDTHPLLEGMDKREQDDPCPYLLAIWTPGETLNSVKPPERQCTSQDSEKLCTNATCLSCNGSREVNSQTVRGTFLIPCRTAMRGSFPLNGTYFQVNEVFSDNESSLNPMDVPREWLWNLPRRTVYFGTSVPTIFKGLSTEGIQYCFWRGFICVRGFDRITRAPRPLIARLHFPASKLARGKGMTDEDET